jgi:hypothetical protein
MRFDDSESNILLVIIVGAFIFGLGLAVLGVYLVTLGGSGESVVDLFGQKLSSKNAGVTSMFIGAVLVILLVRPAYGLITSSPPQHDSLIDTLQTFQKGGGSPVKNTAIIERIANSNNPNKRDYLMQASRTPTISIMEIEAINMALSDLERGVPVSNLLKRCRESEMLNIEAMMPKNSDPLFNTIVKTFKYDRYVCRKDSPSYAKLNEFLGECLANGGFTDRALKLSQELEAELRENSRSEANSVELPRDKAIRLAKANQFSEGMDAINDALLKDQSLVSDAKFVFALARCSAALGDLKTALMALQVLTSKDETVSKDPEFASTIQFLVSKGLTQESLDSMV